jgi:hypothetical protein
VASVVGAIHRPIIPEEGLELVSGIGGWFMVTEFGRMAYQWPADRDFSLWELDVLEVAGAQGTFQVAKGPVVAGLARGGFPDFSRNLSPVSGR